MRPERRYVWVSAPWRREQWVGEWERGDRRPWRFMSTLIRNSDFVLKMKEGMEDFLAEEVRRLPR